MNIDFNDYRASHTEIKKLLSMGLPKGAALDSLEWLARKDFTSSERQVYVNLYNALIGKGPKPERL